MNQARSSTLGDVNAAAGASVGQSASAVQGQGILGVRQISPGGLFLRNPDPKGEYLFETRPQFAKQDQWTSSDYLLDNLAVDHATTQKRLGDGFYEQRLVREQLSKLTGRAPSAAPGDDKLYKQMLSNAASVAQEFNLRPGISLSPEQVSRLTSDIVWLESETVQLPDGSIETVLVPKVYLAHVSGNAVKPTGALVSGASVTIDVSETIMNQGGVIDSGNGRTILLAGEDIINKGGSIKCGDVALQAGRDIRNESLVVDSKWSSKVNGGSFTSLSNQGTISATGQLIMDAGRNVTDLGGAINAGSASILAGNNITFDTVKTGSAYHYQANGSTIDNSATYNQLSRVNVGGDLLMAATGNLNLTGTQLAIGTSGAGAGNLLAGGSVNIAAVVDEVKSSLLSDPNTKNWDKQIHENQAVVGAKVASTGDLLVNAGINQSSDLNIKGSTLAAGGTLTLKASKDLNITSVSESHLSDIEIHRKSGNAVKKSSSDATDYDASTLAIGSSIKGGNVVATIGGDTLIKGSTVLADKDLSIDAKGGLKIVSAEETSKTSSTRQEKKSGISINYSAGNLSAGYGKSKASSQSEEETVTQLASSIGALGGSVKLKSGETLQVVASDIAAKENLTLIGKNVDLAAAQNNSVSQSSTQSNSAGFAMGLTVNPLAAFRSAYRSDTENTKNSNFVGKSLSQAEGLAEGVKAATTFVTTQFGSKSSNSTQNHAVSEARTSSLTAGKDLTIIATDGSITSQGAQISAEGNALLLAKDSIKFDVAHTTETRSQDSKKSAFVSDNRTLLGGGILNNKGDGKGGTDTVTGTKLSVGGSATIATQAGDITLTGANVVSEGNLSINAARDLTITSAQDTLHNANQSKNKADGKVAISDTERFAGYHKEQHSDNSNQVTQVASNVSSLKGDVNLTAGEKYAQTSSNVLAANDVNITAKTIDITALQNTGSHQESNSDLKIGAFARVSSPLIDLVNNVNAARKSDDRLKAMQSMAAVANIYQAASTESGVLIKGEAGIGFASSSNSSSGSDSTAQGSTINGGRNVTLTATTGDIHATGAALNAGKTLSLDAAQNVVLDASQGTLHSDGKNKSSGAEVGVGFQVGAQTGAYVYGSVNVGKGHSKNDTTINNNTELKADTINIKSKGDTTLKGASATANTINTDVGGKLAIESLQDTSQFESVQTNTGVRVQVGFGVMGASGNLSQQKGSGTYAGVGQQSGLFAGDGGYHVKADTIDLKGGAIASNNAAASELTTNKLTTSDIENKMKYSASNVSVAGGISGDSEYGAKDADGNTKSLSQSQLYGTPKSGNMTPGLPMVEKGSDSSTTYATITDGKINIGGVTTNSVKDLGINTDASKANTALDKLPDLQKLLKDQQAMSAAAGTVIATTKQVASDIATEARKAEVEAQKTLNNSNSTDQQKAEATKTIDAAKLVQTEWGVGGEKSRALNVVTGILVGSVAGQASTQIAANAAAPYLAAEIGDYFKKEGNENQSLQNLSHAVLGAALAVANNSSAVSGALAGGGGELAAQVLTKELYPQAFDANGVLQRDKLTPDQVNNVSALSSAIGALLSGMTGASLLDAAVGGKVATNAVENNFLQGKREITPAVYRKQVLDQVGECINVKECRSMEDALRARSVAFYQISYNLAKQGDKSGADEYWALGTSSFEAAKVAAGKAHSIAGEYFAGSNNTNPQTSSGYVELDRSAGQYRDGVTGAAVARVPAASATPWSSALIESDRGTQDYRARQAYETERTLNILSLPFGVAARGAALLAGADELWNTARVVGTVVREGEFAVAGSRIPVAASKSAGSTSGAASASHAFDEVLYGPLRPAYFDELGLSPVQFGTRPVKATDAGVRDELAATTKTLDNSTEGAGKGLAEFSDTGNYARLETNRKSLPGSKASSSAPAVQTLDFPVRTVDSSLDKVNQLRQSLDIGAKRNIAIAEFKINGETGEMVGISGNATRPGTVGAPEKRRFDSITTGNNTRELDSEVKILENLASRLKPDAIGTLHLFSELPLCISCKGVVPQFEQAFPGIRVIVTHGPGR